MKWPGYRTLFRSRERLADASDPLELHAVMEAAYRRALDAEVPVDSMTEDLNRAAVEAWWYYMHRPYYLVYPCVERMIGSLGEDVPFAYRPIPGLSEVQGNIERASVVAHFEDRSPTQLLSVLVGYQVQLGGLDLYDGAREYDARLANPDLKGVKASSIYVIVGRSNGRMYSNTGWHDYSGHTVGNLLSKVGHAALEWVPDSEKEAVRSHFVLGLKLVAALPMLAERGTELLERDVLNRDRGKKPTEAVLRRAEARKGKGWTLGEKMSRDPHAVDLTGGFGGVVVKKASCRWLAILVDTPTRLGVA